MEVSRSTSTRPRPSTCLNRSEWFFAQAGTQAENHIQPLEISETRNFQPELPRHRDAARSLLASSAASSSGSRSSWLSRRKPLKDRKVKEAPIFVNGQYITRHQIAKAFNSILSQTPLPPAGVAQALLNQTSTGSLSELWQHLDDGEELDSNTQMPRNGMGALKKAVVQQNADYVQLICQQGVTMADLNEAFQAAHLANDFESMRILLQFGASADSIHAEIAAKLHLSDFHLLRLLLAKPSCLSAANWLRCLQPQAAQSGPAGNNPVFLKILGIAIASPLKLKLDWEPILISVVNQRDFFATALWLGCLPCGAMSSATIVRVFNSIFSIMDNDLRFNFLELLAVAGLILDIPDMRKELVKSVNARHLPLIKLLVDSGVTANDSRHNALGGAVSRLDFAVLELVNKAVYPASASASVSQVIRYLPYWASEADVVRLIGIYGPQKIQGDALDAFLVFNVREKRLRLVRTLLRVGARITYDNAAALQIAVETADMDILNILLRYECPSVTLSRVVPLAMRIEHRPKRLQAVSALIAKGVELSSLGIALQDLLSEAEPTDLDLLRLLLRNQAPVSLPKDCTYGETPILGSKECTKNPILATIRRGDKLVLRKLIFRSLPRPNKETLQVALAAAAMEVKTLEYETLIEIFNLLLPRAGRGAYLHYALGFIAKLDDRLEIARLLLAHGADPNAYGMPYRKAVDEGRLAMIKLLCDFHRPSSRNLKKSVDTALATKNFRLDILELLLGVSDSVAVCEVLEGPLEVDQLISHAHGAEIAKCLFEYGMDVNKGDGILLALAIKSPDKALLKRFLSAKPSNSSLKKGFDEALSVLRHSLRYEMWEMLLISASSAEIGQSEALTSEVLLANDGNTRGLQLLLEHRANPMTNDGKCILEATACASLEALQLVMKGCTDNNMLQRSFMAAISSRKAYSTQLSMLQFIIDKAPPGVITGDIVTKSLEKTIRAFPDDVQLAKFLMRLGPTILLTSFEDALRSRSYEMFELLAASITDPTIAQRAFDFVQKSRLSDPRKAEALKCLIDKGIADTQLFDALEISILGNPLDLEVPSTILERGVQLNHGPISPLIKLIENGHVRLVALLGQHIAMQEEHEVANIAFAHAAHCQFEDPNVRLEMYKALLQCSVGPSALGGALKRAASESSSNPELIDLLVDNGADPNVNEGACLWLAYRSGNLGVLRALSKRAQVKTVLPILFKLPNGPIEATSVSWLRWFLEQTTSSFPQETNSYLITCMERYPQEDTLVNLFLERGALASTRTEFTFRETVGPETCTALLWALKAEHKISNEVIFSFLKRGDLALPAYTSPKSNISAAFLCLLDKTRTPVLEALLSAGDREILNSTVSGSTLKDLATGGEAAKQTFIPLFEDEDDISLREAALFLGNLDAFRLLDGGAHPDDGTLHLAALLALPNFVRYLIRTHNPSLESEAFDMMVPLALACYSKPFPWCKVANEDSHWADRLKKTMQILMPETKKDWRHRKRTVFHIALENGSDVTNAMMDAMNAMSSAGDAKILTERYVDKTGKEYTPLEYIEEFVDGTEKSKLALRICLRDHGQISSMEVIPNRRL